MTDLNCLLEAIFGSSSKGAGQVPGVGIAHDAHERGQITLGDLSGDVPGKLVHRGKAD